MGEFICCPNKCRLSEVHTDINYGDINWMPAKTLPMDIRIVTGISFCPFCRIRLGDIIIEAPDGAYSESSDTLTPMVETPEGLETNLLEAGTLQYQEGN